MILRVFVNVHSVRSGIFQHMMMDVKRENEWNLSYSGIFSNSFQHVFSIFKPEISFKVALRAVYYSGFMITL